MCVVNTISCVASFNAWLQIIPLRPFAITFVVPKLSSLSYLQLVVHSKSVDVGRRNIIVEVGIEFGDETLVSFQCMLEDVMKIRRQWSQLGLFHLVPSDHGEETSKVFLHRRGIDKGT